MTSSPTRGPLLDSTVDSSADSSADSSVDSSVDSTVDSLLRAVASAPAALPTSSLKARLAGRYSIERLLGEGGMGAVYLAREVQLDRPVALKVIRADLAADPAFRARLIDEAKIAAGLAHPNVVPVHRIDEVDGILLMVMGYVDGMSLRDRLRATGPLRPRDAIALLRDVAWALAHAHAAGIVHRDIKPDNILVEKSSGRVVVADFGIAAKSSSAAMGGTRIYMSPEQARGGDDVDGKSDLYSLGVTAWELFTGLPPRVPVVEPLTGVPVVVADLVERMLRADPLERPQSAGEVASVLTNALEGRRIPPELRAWAEGDRSLDPGFLVLLVPCAVVGIASPFSGAIFTPALVLLYSMVRRATRVRALLRSGHTLDDLVTALQTRLDEGRLDDAGSPRLVPRAVRVLRGARLAGASLFFAAAPIAFLIAATGVGDNSFGAFVGFLLIALLGFALLGAGSVALGLMAPSQTMPWRENIALRARIAVWSSSSARTFAGALRVAPASAPSDARVERRLAVATTILLTRLVELPATDNAANADLASPASLTALVADLEQIAAAARAGDVVTRLVEAVTHLERIHLALEEGAAATDLAALVKDARAFVDRARS